MLKSKDRTSLKSGRRSEAGYILIEVVIALMVIGLLLGTALPLYFAYQTQQQVTHTKAHLEQLKTYLEAYTEHHQNKPPCPSTADASNPHFGEAGKLCTTKQEAIGIIPFVTLGLPPGSAKDAYGHFITYATKPHDRVGQAAMAPLAQMTELKLFPQVTVERDQSRWSTYGDTAEKTPLQFVLVSHGKNGCGAFLSDGSRYQNCAPFGPHEQQNAKDDMKYVQAFPNENEPTYFDDLIIWSEQKPQEPVKTRPPAIGETAAPRYPMRD